MFERYRGDILQHARDEAPFECVGAIWDGEYRRLENVHENPADHFRVSDADALALYEAAGPKALVHSHPTGPAYPSFDDQTQQVLAQIPWVLVAMSPNVGSWNWIEMGDHTLDAPLLERSFMHGVHDCWGAVRAWHHQELGSTMYDVPRDFEWWNNGADLYLDHMEAQGFSRIHPTNIGQLQRGDTFLAKIRSPGIYNHAGVYVGNGLIYHHMPNRLSEVTPLSRWWRRIDFWGRRGSE